MSSLPPPPLRESERGEGWGGRGRASYICLSLHYCVMRRGKGLESKGNEGRRDGWGVGRERGEEELLLCLVIALFGLFSLSGSHTD
jgi:hypothetical protein